MSTWDELGDRAASVPGLLHHLEAAAAEWIAAAESGADEFEGFHWGDEASDLVAAEAPTVRPGEILVELGELTEIAYDTHKKGAWYRWVHEFEKTRPRLAFTSDHRLVIVGGDYTVNDRGIVG